MVQSSDLPVVWPERKASGSSVVRHAAWCALGLAGAAATWLVLPPGVFQAKSIISVIDTSSPIAAILARTASEIAVSKPVMTRAAESLIGTGFPAPEPGFAERAALAARLGGVKATGKTARLADALPRLVVARPGEAPGSVDILASAGDAERASQLASAVADAFITEEDDRIASARRKRDLDVSARLDRLKTEAASARQRLAQLGGLEADPVQALGAAAAQAARAQARVNVIHAIIASSSPPLSDRRDVPSAIETLQAAYLDLTRQLAKARETLGERHTTIIALTAELRHASASLTAEWRRLEHMAIAELSAAREHEASLRNSDAGAGSGRRNDIEQARRTIQLADDDLARALAGARETAAGERGYRILLRPAGPGVATGFAPWMRALLSGLAGFLVLGAGMIVQRCGRTASGDPASLSANDQGDPAVVGFAAHESGVQKSRGDERPVRGGQEAHAREEHAAAPVEDDPTTTVDADAALKQTMIGLMPQIEILDPAFGPIPTVMVAANEATADTTAAALALGRVAAGRGHRVLLIEATRARPKLAAAADTDADPILIDFFGTLRVALPVDGSDDTLFIAPNLQQGARLASTLARAGEAPLVDDLGAEFDLVLIDGGRAADAVAAGWGADAYLRIGRYRSKRDDDLFASALGVSATEILAAIVDASVVEPTKSSASSNGRLGQTSTRMVHRMTSTNAASITPVRYTPQRRKIGAR